MMGLLRQELQTTKIRFVCRWLVGQDWSQLYVAIIMSNNKMQHSTTQARWALKVWNPQTMRKTCTLSFFCKTEDTLFVHYIILYPQYKLIIFLARQQPSLFSPVNPFFCSQISLLLVKKVFRYRKLSNHLRNFLITSYLYSFLFSPVSLKSRNGSFSDFFEVLDSDKFFNNFHHLTTFATQLHAHNIILSSHHENSWKVDQL